MRAFEDAGSEGTGEKGEERGDDGRWSTEVDSQTGSKHPEQVTRSKKLQKTGEDCLTVSRSLVDTRPRAIVVEESYLIALASLSAGSSQTQTLRSTPFWNFYHYLTTKTP